MRGSGAQAGLDEARVMFPRAANRMRRHARTSTKALSILLLAAGIITAGPALATSAEAGPAGPLLTPQRVAALKCAVAACTSLLLLWGIALRRAGRAGACTRLRDALLLALGVLGVLGWWNFLQFRYQPGYGHPLEIYHYYIGSKYFDELGYTRLYACTTVADAESGLRDLASQRSIRNLETYERESAMHILRDPARCTRHFSPERWETFKHDVGWFRARVSEGMWRGALADHGYNPSPAWGALANLFVRDGPVSQEQLFPVVLIDPLLVIVMWAFAWKAFGWRATCVAAVFWGTNLPADYLWTGGGFLRQGWLAAMVIGISCLRMRWMATGGFFLAVAALLRVFPVVTILAVAIGAGLAMARTRRFQLSPAHRRFALGCAAALAILIPLSFATAGGPRAWTDFAENIRFHASRPFATNVGLRMFASYEHETRLERIEQIASNPGRAWSEARMAAFARRRLLYACALIAYLALLARAVDRKEDWVAATLGTGAVIMLTSMSSYYFGVLLGFGFLWERRESIGAGLCGLSAAIWCIDWTWQQPDETYTWVSLATVLFVLAATGRVAWGRTADAESASGAGSATAG
jgi:hypothetical protein